ncbi:MAG: type II toxin-antitoxin system VapB family antitoxin [Methylococcales bacterium]
MRTHIDLDDDLVKSAFRFTSIKSKRELVHLALQEFVENHCRKDVRELIGQVAIDPNYDYKSLRAAKDPDVFR